MLNLGFTELLLIAVVALVVIGPKELPALARQLAKFLRELQGLGDDVKRQLHEVGRESGLDELRRTTIIDLEGKPQQAYDVSDLDRLSGTKPTAVNPPKATGDE